MKTSNNPRGSGVFFTSIPVLFVSFIGLIIFFSCSESNDIGLDLIDTQASLHTTDTLTISAITLEDENLATNFSFMNALGVLNDPVFGKTRASIYTETRLPMNNLSLGDHPILDSVYLVLNYTGRYYGSLADKLTLKVYELAENFPEKDTLYASLEIPHHPKPITKNPFGVEFLPAPLDSVMIDSIMFPPQMRIRLSDEFGQKFIDANGTDAFVNVPNYLEEFKGLYITVDENIKDMGSLFMLNMIATTTSVELYYHNRGDTINRMQRFPINEFANRSTRVEHFGYDHAEESLRLQVQEQDMQMGDSLLFLQSLGVLRANIYIPFLDDLKDLPRLVINRAELVVPVQQDFSTDLLPVTNRLLLLMISEDEELEFMADYFVGINYFGGAYNATKQQYSFNITKYIQQVMDGFHSNNGLALVVSGAAEDLSRVVVHGPGRSERPMKLVIYYSVFD